MIGFSQQFFRHINRKKITRILLVCLFTTVVIGIYIVLINYNQSANTQTFLLSKDTLNPIDSLPFNDAEQIHSRSNLVNTPQHLVGHLNATVVRSNMSAIPDVLFKLSCNEDEVSGYTDIYGEYSVSLGPGYCQLSLQESGKSRLIDIDPIHIVATKKINRTYTLSGQFRELSGQVIDIHGYPISNIILEIERNQNININGDLRPEENFHTTKSNELGRFHFENIYDGVYRLNTVESLNFASSSRAVAAGLQNIKIILSQNRSVVIEGTVVNEFALPLNHVAITNSSSTQTTLSNHNGFYTLPIEIGVEKLFAILDYKATGYHPKSISVKINDTLQGNKMIQDIVLDTYASTGTLQGVVRHQSGLPADARVRLWMKLNRSSFDIHTDSTGLFIFNDIPVNSDANLHIFPESESLDYSTQFFIDKTNHDLGTIILYPVKRVGLKGKIEDVNGTPLSGIGLSLHNINAIDKNFYIQTDNFGEFFVSDVPYGTLYFETLSLPLLTAEGVTYGSDTHMEAHLIMDWGNKKLYGMVINETGLGIGGARVDLTWTHSANGFISKSQRITHTSNTGEFEFFQLSNGNHDLQVLSNDYKIWKSKAIINQKDEPVMIRLVHN